MAVRSSPSIGHEGREALNAALAEPLRPGLTKRHAVVGSLTALALLAYPFVFNGPFYHHLMIMIFLYALMAQSWNILAGYCGQISLGHAVFFGIGAYSSAYLYASHQISPWLGLLVGIALSMGVAALIGVPTLRLHGHYFAIATLVIGESVQIVFLRWEFFNAASGIWLNIVRESPWANFQFHETKIPYYFIALAFLLLGSAVVWVLEHSRPGYYFRAIREDQDAAKSLGINVTGYKTLAFMLSGALMSVAGTFYTQYVMVIDPETVFPLTLSIMAVLMAVMGGVGTIWGPIIGAAVLVPISEASRIYLGGTGGSIDLMIYGLLIVLICVLKPDGLVGYFHHWLGRRRPTKGGPGNNSAAKAEQEPSRA